MTSITLIPELLQKILSYHKENPKIIFKCALVSKSWCDTAIPFLWKKPFRFCYSTFHYKIVRVYLQFLPKKFLDELDFNQIITSDNPAYNYLSFLQELAYLTLYESLLNLLKKQRSYKTLSTSEKVQDDQLCPSFHPSKQFMINKMLPILNELCNLFIKNGTKILNFNLSALYINCSCKCKTSRNISSMEIKKPQSHQNISQWVTLINSQRYLQKLKLEMFYSKYSSMIALAIPSQYHSLKEVELTYSMLGQPSKLEKITLNLIDFFKYPKIIPFICLNCSQLKVLEIVLVEETFEKLVSILENCQLLEEVSIWEKFDWIGHEFYDYHDSYFGNYMNPNLVIKKISNHLPRNLKKLHFSQLFNFTFEDIQYLIQNAPNTLQDLKFYAIVNDKND
ncbi:984_t:CDS:2 [Funneliformis mosseae]|uniref:984_t:CDS:1 n=1 Tax=Funneliformis mosseae TaxID=27381 RepID=A0A9N8YKU5_FUNMO|nr:984_t:CDS:2 [Funneliformis mosseae]